VTYLVRDYLSMIGDEARTGAYVRALRKMVTPESVVLDLGAGFGFFAVLAAKLGARRAYAIEPNDAVSLGPALARANGVADRVTFFQGDSRRVELPERANLLVEDVRGTLPLQGERIQLLADARARLLSTDARFVAMRDHLWAAPVREPEPVRRDLEMVGPDSFGVDLRGLRSFVMDTARRVKLDSEHLLLPGALLGTLELVTATEPNFEGTAHWTPGARMVADGFVLWFDAELAEGEHFSSQPGPGQSVHGSLYLPLRAQLVVPEGAELSLRFCGVQADADYVWTWECTVGDSRTPAHARTVRQSTLGALGLSPARLSALSDAARPSLGLEGRRWHDAMSLIDGQRSWREIADALVRAGDDGFATSAEAFAWLQRVLNVLAAGEVTEL